MRAAPSINPILPFNSRVTFYRSLNRGHCFSVVDKGKVRVFQPRKCEHCQAPVMTQVFICLEPEPQVLRQAGLTEIVYSSPDLVPPLGRKVFAHGPLLCPPCVNNWRTSPDVVY